MRGSGNDSKPSESTATEPSQAVAADASAYDPKRGEGKFDEVMFLLVLWMQQWPQGKIYCRNKMFFLS